MAWIFHLQFLIPAVQMSLTALLITRNPAYAYAIYGVSWCVALHAVGLSLERRRGLYLAACWAFPSRSNSPVRNVDLD